MKEDEKGVVVNMRSVLKALIIVTVGTVAFCLCLVYFGGIIEQAIEILLYLLCVAGLAAAFILGAQVYTLNSQISGLITGSKPCFS